MALLSATIALAGCGDGSDPEPAVTDSRPTETSERLPRLPQGWKPHLNRAAGLAFGVPPGWRATDRGTASLIRSSDRLLAVSITPDRSQEALELPLGEFATRTLAAFPGYEHPPRPRASRPFEHRYEARSVSATARTKRGLEERITVIVLRRPELATFAIAIASNAEREGSKSRVRLAERLVGTLRGRPVSGG